MMASNDSGANFRCIYLLTGCSHLASYDPGQFSKKLDQFEFQIMFDNLWKALVETVFKVDPKDGCYTWQEVESILVVLGLYLKKKLFCSMQMILDPFGIDAKLNGDQQNDIKVKTDTTSNSSKQSVNQSHFNTIFKKSLTRMTTLVERFCLDINCDRYTWQEVKSTFIVLRLILVKNLFGIKENISDDIRFDAAVNDYRKDFDNSKDLFSSSLNDIVKQDNLGITVKSATAGSSKQLGQPIFGTNSQSLETSGHIKELTSSIDKGATAGSSIQLDQPLFGTNSQSLETSGHGKDLTSSSVEGATAGSSRQLNQPLFGTNSQSLETSGHIKDLTSSIVEGATAGSSRQLNQPLFGTNSQSLETSGYRKDLTSSIDKGATAGSSKQLDQPFFGTNSQSLETSGHIKELTSSIDKGATAGSSIQLDQPLFGTNSQSLETSGHGKDLTSSSVEGATAGSSRQLNQPLFGTNSQSLETSGHGKDLTSSSVEGATAGSSRQLNQPLFGTNSQSLETSGHIKDLTSSIDKGATAGSSKQLDQPFFGTNSQSLETLGHRKDLTSSIDKGATAGSSKQLNQPLFGTNSDSNTDYSSDDTYNNSQSQTSTDLHSHSTKKYGSKTADVEIRTEFEKQIFSKSLLNLDLIEKFLKIKTEEFVKSYEGDQGSYDDVRRHNDGVCHYWHPDIDYFRIDGKVKSGSRSSVIDQFNEPQNQRARLMLVSTRAGGIGINLVGANRCIIFDVSWNPSHDLQAIYRIFRFGQEKPVYVYRFVASGTMESKIYKRQIVKESLSRRVIDQHNIRSQYSASELQELYRFTDPDSEQQQLNVPNDDPLLAGIMESHGKWIISNHQQDSLLENDPEQALTQAERQLAMDEYRREIVQMQDSDSE